MQTDSLTEAVMTEEEAADAQEVRRLLTLYDTDWEFDRENREQGIEDLNFCAGEQWDELDRQQREAAGKPVQTVNQTRKFTEQVTGDLRQNRPSIVVKPNGFGADEEKARIINGIIRNIQRRARSTEPYINALEDAVQAGIGHFRIVTGYLPDNPFDQEISVVPVADGFSVVWDANARMPDRSDAKRCFVMSSMDKAAFEAKWPGKYGAGFDSKDFNTRGWFPSRDVVMIAEVFEIVEEETTFLKLENEAILDAERLPKMLTYHERWNVVTDVVGNIYKVVKSKRAMAPRCKWKKISGEHILERGEWVTPHIPIVPIAGPEIVFEKKVVRESLIRWMKDPARSYNYWLSSMTEMVGNMPRAPWMVGASQLSGVEKSWANMATSNLPYQVYNDQPKDGQANTTPPQRQAPPTIPPAFMALMNIADANMRSTSGIQNAALGEKSNESSGVAIRERKMESDVATSVYGARLQGALERAATILVAAIPRIYDYERTAKIVLEDDSEEMVTLNTVKGNAGIYSVFNDITQGRYDVSADIGPSYASQLQEGMEKLESILRDNPTAKVGMLDILVKGLNLPNSKELEKRAKRLMPPGLTDGNDPDADDISPALAQKQEMDRLLGELEMRLKRAEATEKEARAEEAVADAEEKRADALLTKIRAAIEAGNLPPGAAEILRRLIQTPMGEVDPSLSAARPPVAAPAVNPLAQAAPM